MTVKIYLGQEITKYEGETEQFREIQDLINKEYGRKKEPVYILGNIETARSQIDVIILMKNGIIILDLKAIKGEIEGSENGEWIVKKDSKETLMHKNLFQQLRTQKFDLLEKLNIIVEKNIKRIDRDKIGKIQAWGYFKNGSVKNCIIENKPGGDSFVNWYENGAVSVVGTPVVGEEEEASVIIKYHQNGNIKEKMIANNGKQLWEAYYENGKKFFKGYIVDAPWSAVGRWVWWYENGKKKKE